MVYFGDDGNYREIEKFKKSGKYSFATCYDISWGFLLPCDSGIIWEQQTDGVCCHHVYVEGILIPLCSPVIYEDGQHTYLLGQLANANYDGNPTDKIWEAIRKKSHIDFEFVESQQGVRNQEGVQWIVYHGHEEGWGNRFCIEAWKGKPILLIYPNCD